MALLKFGRSFLAVLRSRSLLASSVTGVCLLMALAYGLLAKDRYEAVATLFIDPSARESGANGAGGSVTRSADLDLLRSERVAQRVVENEHLVEEPELHGLYLESIDAGQPPLEMLARTIAEHVEARAAGDGSLVRLMVFASEPALAARIANAYALAWGEVGQELRAASIRNGVERAHQDLVALRARLGEARARNRDDRGLGVTDEHANEQFAQLSRMATRPMRPVSGPVPGLSMPMTEAQNDASPEAAGMMITAVDPAAPRFEVGALAAAGGAARKGVAGTGASRASTISSADEEIHLAQQSLERAEDRLALLAAEGVGAPFPVHVLLAARVPDASAKPALAICAAGGLALGLLFGILAMGIAEVVDRRVRRGSDLARGLGIVVLGSLPATLAKPAKQSPAANAGTRWLPWQRAGSAA
jgi:uncharacterized protein involved in exopolysaccharide biosynthesis